MERIIALDYGEKRIGAAISDPLGLTAQPLEFIPNDQAVISTLKEIIYDRQVDEILIGLPKNMNGTESKKSEEAMAFGKKLEEELDIKVSYWDERLSTVAVTKHLINADVSRKKRKKVVDSQAAMFFLQGYMNSKH